MECQQVMQTNVMRLTPHNSVREAAGLMREQNLGFIPVCELDGKLIGAITDRDIALRIVSEGRPADDTPIGAVLTRAVVSCHQTDDLRTAERLMAEAHVARILCVDDAGALRGVIGLPDIIEHEDPGRATELLRVIWAREARGDQPV